MNRLVLTLTLTSLNLFCLTSCDSRQSRQEKYPNGKLKEEFSVVEMKDGSFLKEGKYKSWYDNGQPKMQGTYSKGRRVGLWHSWYQTGQKESAATFQNDTLHGAFVNYFPEGKKNTEGQFSHGQQTGPWSVWNNRGTLISKTSFNNENQMHGLQEVWSENGVKLIEENYSNGQRDGRCKQWTIDGTLYVSATFKDGSLSHLPATFKTEKGEIINLLSPTTYRIKFLSNRDNYYKWEWQEVSGNYTFKQLDFEPLKIEFGNDYLYKIDLIKLTNDTILGERFLFVRSK